MNTASWVFGPGREEQAKEIFLTAIRLAAGDAESAKAEAREYKTLEQWRRQLRRRVGVAAGGTALIPGLHGGGIALEIPYLFRLMGRGAIGTGGLMGAEIEPEADLLAIFALWSGAINEAALLAAVGGVVVVDSVVYPAFGAKALAIGLKLTAGTVIAHAGIGGVGGMAMGKATGVVTHMLQPVFGHFLAAISAKISAKIGAKIVAGTVPLLGAGVGAAISVYILTEFLTAARTYYGYKLRDFAASRVLTA